MFKYIIIGIVLLIIAIAVSLYVISKNRFKRKEAKIEEAVKQINELLNDKYQSLNTVNNLIKDNDNLPYLLKYYNVYPDSDDNAEAYNKDNDPFNDWFN